MYLNGSLLIGKNKDYNANIILKQANRHGLITGASGTGKTTTVKVLAESFSAAGVPVFVSDVKGDLAGCAYLGEANESISKRVEELELNEFDYKAFPTRFWDIYGNLGHPIRTTVKEVGANILSMMLGLNDAQDGVLNLVFKIAKDENLKLIDLKDLRLVLQYVGDNRNKYITKYGNITTSSIGVISRGIITLESQGGEYFFGEPSLDIHDFLQVSDGRGFINILDAVKLFQSPDLYASFLLWLLTHLFETLPEVGDLDKPKIVFFFDEAHLLFNGMPDYRLKQIVQVVKLIRSRGIGLYFISQSPKDIPDEILAQLSNRIQHGLRAYTPSEQKVVKAASESFRVNPKFKTYDEILNLATGEALVSFLNINGEPEIVEKVKILPPESKMGTIDEIARNKIINSSTLLGKYDELIDNESAFEVLSKQIEEKEQQESLEKEKKEQEKLEKEQKKEEVQKQKELEKDKKEAEKKKREEEKALKNSIGYKLGKKVANKTVDKVINKGLNSIIKKLFK